jgi:hypothetical protein
MREPALTEFGFRFVLWVAGTLAFAYVGVQLFYAARDAYGPLIAWVGLFAFGVTAVRLTEARRPE